MGTRRKQSEAKLLSGWKEIANHLHKGVRTVQRYEREFSLPVRRPAGKSLSSVIAIEAELDGWVAAAPFRKEFRLSQESVNKSTIDTRRALNELNRQVDALRRLRAESAELRAALHESVESLRKNLRFNLIGESLERRGVADVFSFPSKKIH